MAAASGKYGCWEIASQGRPFYVISMQADIGADREIQLYNRSATNCTTTAPVANAANSETEFGSVATNSLVQKGHAAVPDSETDSFFAWPAGTSVPLSVRFEIQLYVGPDRFFSAVSSEVNTSFFLQFVWAEVVQG